MSTINALGFSRLEMAAIKRNFQNVKPLYKKIAKLEKVLSDSTQELEMLNAEASANDDYSKRLSTRVIGYPLTSKEILNYVENPEEWEKFKESKNILPTSPARPATEAEEKGEASVPDMQSPTQEPSNNEMPPKEEEDHHEEGEPFE